MEICKDDCTTTWLRLPGESYNIVFPEVTDAFHCDCLKLTVELETEGEAELELCLRPLHIARPEFFPETRTTVWVSGKENFSKIHLLEIPFAQFDFSQMVRAHLKYLDSCTITLKAGTGVRICSLVPGRMGRFHVFCDRTSHTGKAGTWLSYPVTLVNEGERTFPVYICQSRYGKETFPVQFPQRVTLAPGESRQIILQIKLPLEIPEGGMEKATFLFTSPECVAENKTLTLTASISRPHPYLLFQPDQWERRRESICGDPEKKAHFAATYEKRAEQWQVPAPSSDVSYVYPSEDSQKMFGTAIAWKITGKEGYLNKVLTFLRGLLSAENGYLSTSHSYFIFIESRDEYARGDFKVRRAVNAGWVQEAESFIRLALTYDMVFDFFTQEEQEQMEECLRNYMDFEDWRLTDGDGNNFQIAESGAGLLCAMVLQDEAWIDRFVHGYNGFEDLLSSVLLDDGMYFEEASGYVKLAGGLFFDTVNAAENYGLGLKDLKVPASFDRNILHSPWAMRETWAEDKKPFLGMSFRKYERFTNPVRTLKQYFDCVADLLSEDGILFSINDSNEQNFCELYQKAWYLYGDERYRRIAERGAQQELLFVRDSALQDSALIDSLSGTCTGTDSGSKDTW